MYMTIEEYACVQEFLFDHHKHFGAWPSEVEPETGNIYTFADFNVMHFLFIDAANLITGVSQIGDNPEYERGMAELIAYNVWQTGDAVDKVLLVIHKTVHYLNQ